MCALLRWWRQLCASFGKGTGREQKSGSFDRCAKKKFERHSPRSGIGFVAGATIDGGDAHI